MKKLLKKLRDWVIVKLGGVTPEAYHAECEEVCRRYEEYEQGTGKLALENVTLKAENAKLQNEIGKLNFALAEKWQPYEFKIGTMEIKPFRLVCSHKRDELFAEAEIEAAKFRMRREMASSIGRQLLEKGAIRVSERENPVNDSIDVLMEVRVVC